MAAGDYVDGSIWFYAPNKVLPVIWSVFFAFSFVMHIWQCIHFEAWKFTGLLVFSTAVFLSGYIYREVGAYNYTNIIDYIVSLCLVYGAAPLYELCNYVVLGRILYYVPYYSPIHPGRVITTFGFLSSVVEVLNGQGASLLSNVTLSQHKQQIGHNLLRAGLAIQLAVITFFLALAISFQRRCTKHGLMPKHLHSIFITLYCSTALVGTRTIYRTVEYFAAEQIHVVPGFNPMSINPIIRYEWFFWVFEATLMCANTLLLNFRHPAMYLPRSNKIYLAEDGVTEIAGPGFEDKRPFLLTIFDPCDLAGLVKGRDKKERYWENHERVVPNRVVELTPADVPAQEKPKKSMPWEIFKRCFLLDRGQQGLHTVVLGAVDVEKEGGRRRFGFGAKATTSPVPAMAGPTKVTPAMAGPTSTEPSTVTSTTAS